MRHRIEYGLVRFVRGAIRLMPHGMVRGLGAVLGLMFYAVDRGHRRVALANLEQCFPSRSVRRAPRASRGRCSRTSAGCCSRC